MEDEDDDTFSYSVRISAQDLLLVRAIKGSGVALFLPGKIKNPDQFVVGDDMFSYCQYIDRRSVVGNKGNSRINHGRGYGGSSYSLRELISLQKMMRMTQWVVGVGVGGL